MKITAFKEKRATDMKDTQGSASFFLNISRDSHQADSLAVPGRIFDQSNIETPGEVGKNVPE
jgi:hypothetical protein